jgi:hypothetical protein
MKSQGWSFDSGPDAVEITPGQGWSSGIGNIASSLADPGGVLSSTSKFLGDQEWLYDALPVAFMAGAGGALGAAAGAGAASSEIGAASFSTPATTATEFGMGGASFGTGASVPASTTLGTGIASTTVPTSTLTGLGAAGGAAGGATGVTLSNMSATDLLLVSSGISQLGALAGGSPESPSFGAASMDMGGERTSSSIANRDTDFETRRQKAGRAAAAAGVTRNDNEADLLGVVGRTTSRRAVGGQRSILGY